MYRNHSRGGRALRLLLVVLAAAVVLPMIMLALAVVAYQSTRVEAQERNRNRSTQIAEDRSVVPREASVPVQVGGPNFASSGDPDSVATQPEAREGFRPVTETAYREETVEIKVPVLDPATGQQVEKLQRVIRRVPVMTTRYVRTHPSGHDPKTTQLVNELRSMTENDKQRGEKIDELRQRLDSEFSKMHEQQAEEIARTQQRLDSLKSVHQQRGDNRDKIVQRRIDELLGKPDSLRWEISPQPTAVPGPSDLSIPMQQPLSNPPQFRGSSRLEIKVESPPGSVPQNSDWRDTPHIRSIESVAGVNPDPMADAVPGIAAVQPPRPPSFLGPPNFLGSDERTRVNLMPSGIQDFARLNRGSLFDLARSAAAAKTELDATEAELERLEKLGERDAVAASVVAQAALKIRQLKKQLRLDELELESLAQQFQRELDLAVVSLERLTEARELAKTRFASGRIQQNELMEVELKLEKARKTREDAAAQLHQLTQARSLIESPEVEQADPAAPNPTAPNPTLPDPENVLPDESVGQ